MFCRFFYLISNIQNTKIKFEYSTALRIFDYSVPSLVRTLSINVTGLFGSSSMEAFLIDELLEVMMELMVKQATKVFMEQDPEKKVGQR